MKRLFLIFALCSTFLASSHIAHAKKTWVKSYVRKDGTRVSGHWRNSPGSGSSKTPRQQIQDWADGEPTPQRGPTPGHDATFLPQTPDLEPSWIRQQRMERAEQARLQPKPQTKPKAETIPAQFSGRVIGVSDGDTITVLRGTNQPTKIRLYGIDTPEKAQPFGTQAKNFTSEKTFGKTATVYSKGVDRYGRVLGWVFIGTECVNTDLVKSGLAWHYVQYAKNETKLATIQTEAQTSRAGLWADATPTAPWEWRKND